MSRHDPPDNIDVMTGMRFSTLNPTDVSEVISAWRSTNFGDLPYRVGFVARLQDGHPHGTHVYVVLYIDDSRKYENVSTQYFNDEPKHLYERSENWFIGGDVIADINKNLGYSKAHAKYGTSSDTFHTTKTRPVVRIPT